MKFTCERCGKKYATAEDPAPGRVYKLRCKACGHLIVVKAAAAAAPGQPPSAPPEPPSIGLEIGTPEPAQIPAPPVPAGRPALGSTAEASAAAMRSQHDLELTPRQGDSGYVDLFADVPDGPANLAQKGEDPFLAAARASLPETHGSAALEASPDPFADLRDDLSAAAPSEPAPRSQPSVPKVPVIPKPEDQGRSVVPLVLIGAGVAVMVGILAFALLSSGRRGPPRAPPPPAVATPAPAAQAPAAPAAEPAEPAPAQAGAAPPAPAPQASPPKADDSEKRGRAEPRQRDPEEAAARAERAAEAKARQRQARQAAAAESAAAEPEGGLTQAQIESVLRSTKPAFDGCIQAARGKEALDGRRVMLRLDIQSSGAVTSPTLDDVTLDGTDLGTCLKSAARLMVFPKFKGDAMRVEVPLVIR